MSIILHSLVMSSFSYDFLKMQRILTEVFVVPYKHILFTQHLIFRW